MENPETASAPPVGKYELAAIPVWKFILYSVVSAGLYQLVWFSRIWFYLKQERGLKIWPVWRAFFGNLFAGTMAGHIQKLLVENGLKSKLMPVLIGISYFILTSLNRIPDPRWLLSTLSFVPLIPIVMSVNRYSTEKLGKPPRHSMKWWHVILVIIGFLFWIFVIIGTFLPEPDSDVDMPTGPLIPIESSGATI